MFCLENVLLLPIREGFNKGCIHVGVFVLSIQISVINIQIKKLVP